MADLTSLENSLLLAKKFMNHEKLQTTTNNSTRDERPMRESMVDRSVPEPMLETPSLPQNSVHGQMPQEQSNPRLNNLTPHASLTEESINNSRLPDAIKEAMISHPIPDIQSQSNLNPDFIDRVSKKMNDTDYTLQGMRNTANPTLQEPLRETQRKVKKSPIPSPNATVDSNDLKNEIKTLISESLDELIENKVNKMLMTSTNIKETIHFRVGNKLFTGKISKVKTIKS